jgi:bisanhydrobacterioruberin hydratase
MQGKTKVATIVAAVVHAGGIWGMTSYDLTLFAAATPANLLLCFSLLLYTQSNINRHFIVFCLCSGIIGFVVEAIGVNTGYLFGHYKYLPAMGPQWLAVPLVISINWAMTMLCCGFAVSHLRDFMNTSFSALKMPQWYRRYGLAIEAAVLATITDFILEPAAIKLGFWQWNEPGGLPPTFNYVCWFVVSLFIMLIFNTCKFSKRNSFAVYLLFIQMAFFILINNLS